jgi:hypothetical protein
MFTEFEINSAHFRAFQECIACHTVIILMGGGHQVGTGTLISYGSTNLILTANHNLTGITPSDLLIGFKPGGTFQEVTMSEFKALAPTLRPDTPYRLNFRGDVIRDMKNDIAVLPLDEKERPRGVANFYEATTLKPVAIHNGASVMLIGFPVGYSAHIRPGKKLVGATPDHLVYDSTLSNSKYLPSSYDPEDEFLLRYRWIEDGLLPHGYSGAAAWCSREEKAIVWTPNPMLVGVVTGYLKEHRFLVVAGLRSILDLLSQV